MKVKSLRLVTSMSWSCLNIGAVIVLLAMIPQAPALAQPSPSHGEVYVRSLSHGGSGCGVGTVAENISPDAKAFTLVFSNYAAEIGPNVPRVENRKFCNILVDLKVPSGWSYSLFRVDYRGYVNLDAGVQGVQQSSYYFQGLSVGTRPFRTVFNGPIDRNYQTKDALALEASNWSPCGVSRALVLQTEVRLTSSQRRAQGIITTDSINGEVEHKYGVQWKRCGRF